MLYLDEVKKGRHPSGLDDRILQDRIVEGKLCQRGGCLLLHPDARAEVHLRAREDGLRLDRPRDADSGLAPERAVGSLRVKGKRRVSEG